MPIKTGTDFRAVNLAMSAEDRDELDRLAERLDVPFKVAAEGLRNRSEAVRRAVRMAHSQLDRRERRKVK